jgi:mannose/fructose/N-acetylgalactosamine-specific phosphotransferase system component IIC
MEMLKLIALGGLLGLDATGVGQFMASRPLVAGALTGWLLGDVALGVTIGVVLELYLLVSFPTGGARFPEGATATVVAVASAAPFPGAGAVPLAVAVGLVWGQLGGSTITLQRHVNSRLVPEPGEARSTSAGTLVGTHLTAIVLDFLRGAVVTTAGVLVGRAVLGALVTRWPLPLAASTGLVLVGGAVSAGILLRDLGGFRRRRIWFAAGLALGIAGARLL